MAWVSRCRIERANPGKEPVLLHVVISAGYDDRPSVYPIRDLPTLSEAPVPPERCTAPAAEAAAAPAAAPPPPRVDFAAPAAAPPPPRVDFAAPAAGPAEHDSRIDQPLMSLKDRVMMIVSSHSIYRAEVDFGPGVPDDVVGAVVKYMRRPSNVKGASEGVITVCRGTSAGEELVSVRLEGHPEMRMLSVEWTAANGLVTREDFYVSSASGVTVDYIERVFSQGASRGVRLVECINVEEWVVSAAQRIFSCPVKCITPKQ